jgi:chromate transporter
VCVDQEAWISPNDFEDAVAATNLLPGPASTQLAIYCAWRLGGPVGAIVGGACFILPGLVLIIALSALFLARHPPSWILGAATGAGAAVPAVALHAASSLTGASLRRIGNRPDERVRWTAYALGGAAIASLEGAYLVPVLVACGLVEMLVRRTAGGPGASKTAMPAVVHTGVAAGLGPLAWVAFKVGALSYGGGFVIIPLMQHDVVKAYHWMTAAHFLDAVALGQITPGPVVQTVSVVGYAAGGVGGALLAALVAFTPSFLFVLFGAPSFDKIRSNEAIGAFLTGSGPAVIGAISGSAIALGLLFQHLWQIPLLAGALVWLFALRRGVVSTLLIAGGVGVLLALSGVAV